MKYITAILLIISVFITGSIHTQNIESDLVYTAPAIIGNNTFYSYITPSSKSIEELLSEKRSGRTILGYTAGSRPIEAFYFPGRSEKNALVIGGMHGSELSSIEVANMLIAMLQESENAYYNVVVIPSLFPDNFVKAINSVKETNAGRYTTSQKADPNRQMPSLGKEFDNAYPLDHHNRLIEYENQVLLDLIQKYKPSRIVNLHAIRDTSKAGVFADPRTDCTGLALGFETDSSLAVSMAGYIFKNGGMVPGNNMAKHPTALYHSDPKPVSAGKFQLRNLLGSKLPSNRGAGVSLGSWATTAVCEGSNQRKAIRLITMEFPGYRSSVFYANETQKLLCLENAGLYATAILNIFLEENYVE